MSSARNEIVLVDSDDSNIEDKEQDDEGQYNQPPSKKHKPLTVTPFNDRSSPSSQSDNDHDDDDVQVPVPEQLVSSSVNSSLIDAKSRYDFEEDEDDEDDEQENIRQEEKLVPRRISQDNDENSEEEEEDEVDEEDVEGDDDDEGDDDEDQVEVLSLPSSLALPSSNSKQVIDVNSDDSGNDEEHDHEHHGHDYDSDEDSELDTVSFEQVGAVSPTLVAETRKYLKQHGTLKFLEKYLPTAASSEDILKLILKLGFFPRELPKALIKSNENVDDNTNNDNDNEDLMRLIGILNRAMIKVKSIRNRLDHVQTIDDALRLLKTSKKILVITGAGISTSLGIPDFRSSQGFYNQLQHLGLSDPQEVFDLQLFLTDPSLFYSIAFMILPPEKIYSPLHSFIKLLQSKGKLLRNYTQNIDNLESYAGISSSKLIQCHGSFATATCITCKYQIQGELIFDKIRNKDIPYCPKCNKIRNQLLRDDEDVYIAESFGVFKPDITFFGEPLPKTFHDMINQDLHECDLLISIGTSLKVAPVADIVDKVPPEVPQILINKDPINHCNFDVSLLGYCDDVASYLSNELGESWALPHEKYKQIIGTDPEGSNLEVNLVDEDYREYEIINKTTRAREDQEAAAMASEIAVDSNDELKQNDEVVELEQEFDNVIEIESNDK